ncbi:alcohol dehydrogenase catalytic domain-containing protein [Novosphingobium sp. TH158]|uniref:alcohol dehydrogenase catalytic domain-containing protein n=1 Tax=Novosphingobium sp. TH158 TaxID=2067455 RepID=UPI000C7BEA63|nr:NADH oxidase [Novosphingobium sp. TH158]PLK25546.1 NADH oxidase [Novosphingobium sp. TH158]
MTTSGQQVTTTLGSDGKLTVAVEDRTFADPTGTEVLVKVEAAPINPSDLALLFGMADLAGADYSPGKLVAEMPAIAMKGMAARVGQKMDVGAEGCGTVIAAGEDAYAQSLIGKRVACRSGALYATHTLTDSRACIPLPDHITAEQGAGAFVNPLTALGFVETMRADGYTGIVHTAAASNLGQMLVKLCAAEGIPLVNVVRSEAQAEILRGIGAQYVVDSSKDDFMPSLVAAIEATGAMLGFDAIGGGTMASTILGAMEQVASRGAEYSRYGSSVPKKVFIYGALDLGPIVLNRGALGFAWDVSGWLLIPFLAKQGVEGQMRLAAKVIGGLTTTFASHYKAKIGLAEMLTRDVAMAYNAKATGEKYLVTP